MKEYKAHYIVPVVYTFMAENDEVAAKHANDLSLRQIWRGGDPGYPDLGCDGLIEVIEGMNGEPDIERTIFNV